MVDSNDRERAEEAREELGKMVGDYVCVDYFEDIEAARKYMLLIFSHYFL